MQNELMQWLASDLSEPVKYFQKQRESFAILRVSIAPEFDYLYEQSHYYREAIQRGEAFEYAGIYCRKDGKLYDAQYALCILLPECSDDLRTRGRVQLAEQLKADVCARVCTMIGNDRRNLTITALSEEKAKELEAFRGRQALDRATRYYLSGRSIEDTIFQCSYTREPWSDQNLLRYILDPDDYVQQEATAYFETHQEQILLELLEDDAILAAWRGILDDPQHRLHMIRRIRDAVSQSGAKRVRVTIHKDGKELTFQTDAHTLCTDFDSSYNCWDILPQDRRRFEETFGRYAEYGPEDVTCITYAKRTLYTKT